MKTRSETGEKPWFRDFCCVVDRCVLATVSNSVLQEGGSLEKLRRGCSQLNLCCIEVSRPNQPSLAQAGPFSAHSTWPNYIQSEGKDSPLWSTWVRQPGSGWLVWHLMLLSARHFSRTDVFECCLKSSTVESVCVCEIIRYVCRRMHTCFGTSGEQPVKQTVAPFR